MKNTNIFLDLKELLDEHSEVILENKKEINYLKSIIKELESKLDNIKIKE